MQPVAMVVTDRPRYR